MNERELSKLSYLMAPIASEPRRYQSILRLVDHPFLTKPSSELEAAINELYRLLSKHECKLEPVIDELLNGDPQRSFHDAKKAAGRSLKWAYDNRETYDKRLRNGILLLCED